MLSDESPSIQTSNDNASGYESPLKIICVRMQEIQVSFIRLQVHSIHSMVNFIGVCLQDLLKVSKLSGSKKKKLEVEYEKVRRTQRLL